MKPNLASLASQIARRVQAGARYDELPRDLILAMESLSPAEQAWVEAQVVDAFEVEERRRGFRSLVVGAALMAFVALAGNLLADVFLYGLKGAGY